jgi:hypothetical protein
MMMKKNIGVFDGYQAEQTRLLKAALENNNAAVPGDVWKQALNTVGRERLSLIQIEKKKQFIFFESTVEKQTE